MRIGTWNAGNSCSIAASREKDLWSAGKVGNFVCRRNTEVRLRNKVCCEKNSCAFYNEKRINSSCENRIC
jgi:hypothetical protein